MTFASRRPQNVSDDPQVLPYDAAARRLSGSTNTLLGAARRESATMANRPKLDLVNASDAVRPPADLGRLWYDDEIPVQFFRGRVTVRWVREHLPREKGLKIGRGWAWYENDIVEWIASRRGITRASA